MAQGFKVDFIGIGAPRSGSTWLFHALGRHPAVCLSEPKEIKYFNREDFLRPVIDGDDESPYINPNHARDLDWYARHYRHCPADSLKGEFSPQYLFDDAAPARIHTSFPDVKLLVCLRNPIDRIHATYCAYVISRKTRTRPSKTSLPATPACCAADTMRAA